MEFMSLNLHEARAFPHHLRTIFIFHRQVSRTATIYDSSHLHTFPPNSCFFPLLYFQSREKLIDSIHLLAMWEYHIQELHLNKKYGQSKIGFEILILLTVGWIQHVAKGLVDLANQCPLSSLRSRYPFWTWKMVMYWCRFVRGRYWLSIKSSSYDNQ